MAANIPVFPKPKVEIGKTKAAQESFVKNGDTNHDYCISPAEFAAMMGFSDPEQIQRFTQAVQPFFKHLGLKTEQGEQISTRTFEKLLTWMDWNKDGAITAKELQGTRYAVSHPPKIFPQFYRFKALF